jgi:hypothetical protein
MPSIYTIHYIHYYYFPTVRLLILFCWLEKALENISDFLYATKKFQALEKMKHSNCQGPEKPF